MNWTINIDKRPYHFTEFYGGKIYSNKKVHKFILKVFDDYEEVTWIEEGKPKSYKQVELDIIKHFQRR